MRVNMSEIVSVIIWLPACFLDTRNFSAVGEFTEADTAESESAHKSTLTSAAPTTVDAPSHKLRLLSGLRNLVSRRHNLLLFFGLKREAQRLEESYTFFMRFRGSRNRHLDAVNRFDFLSANLRESYMFTEAVMEVSSAVHG